MPVKFRCPECHRMIAVPSKLVGTTINCPHNGCLVQVRPDKVSQAQGGNGAVSHGSIPIKLLEEEEAAAGMSLRLANPESSAGGPPAKADNWVRRNVARFIPGGGVGAGSTLVSEGRLPELKLQEGQARRGAGDGEATNPLVMVGVLCLSFVMSTALLLYDFETPRSNSLQVQARKKLPEFYRQTTGPLAPYQQYLRDAERAHSRGDEKTEHQMYRKVLQLLRSEGRGRYATLTGGSGTDRDLKKALADLMAEE